MSGSKEIKTVPSTEGDSVSPEILLELQRSFFHLISQAETAKIDRIEAKKRYEEKVKIFEEARQTLFAAAEFLQKHQPPSQSHTPDWLTVAQHRLQALDPTSPPNRL